MKIKQRKSTENPARACAKWLAGGKGQEGWAEELLLDCEIVLHAWTDGASHMS